PSDPSEPSKPSEPSEPSEPSKPKQQGNVEKDESSILETKKQKLLPKMGEKENVWLVILGGILSLSVPIFWKFRK
ncbi:LPXTG cell wall anchor domain-containing protein, partial [Enterococcus sp. MJM12]